MRLIEIEQGVEKAMTSDVAIAQESVVAQTSYHEMADRPVIGSDALSQLHENVALLGDLQGRLSFMMKEIRYVLKAGI